MTDKEAKELSIEIWQYLYDHPDIYHKKDLPESIFNQIKDIVNFCPLCFVRMKLSRWVCIACPISMANKSCFIANSYYRKWERANVNRKRKRKKYAGKILNIIKDWEI